MIAKFDEGYLCLRRQTLLLIIITRCKNCKY